MVQFPSINFFSWISSIFVGFFKSSRFFVSPRTFKQAMKACKIVVPKSSRIIIRVFLVPFFKEQVTNSRNIIHTMFQSNTNHSLYKIISWQHVSTLLSHHQALHRTDPKHIISQCILGFQMLSASNMFDAVLYVPIPVLHQPYYSL